MIVAGPAVEIAPIDWFQCGIENFEWPRGRIDRYGGLRRGRARDRLGFDMSERRRRVVARFGFLGEDKDREGRNEEQKISPRHKNRPGPIRAPQRN